MRSWRAMSQRKHRGAESVIWKRTRLRVEGLLVAAEAAFGFWGLMGLFHLGYRVAAAMAHRIGRISADL